MLIKKPGLTIHNFKAFPPEEEQGDEPKGEKSPKNWNKTSRVLVEVTSENLDLSEKFCLMKVLNLENVQTQMKVPSTGQSLHTKVKQKFPGFQNLQTFRLNNSGKSALMTPDDQSCLHSPSFLNHRESLLNHCASSVVLMHF